MTLKESDKIVEKITKGIKLSIQRLIANTQQTDGELIFSKNGKIIRVKARELK